MPIRKPLRSVSKPGHRVRVALAGFGTVGSSVVRVLAAQDFDGLELTHIFNRNVAKKRKRPEAKLVPKSTVWTQNIDDILNSDVDILIELTGGLDPALSWHRRALSAGKSVVTANKQLIAAHGPELAKLARDNRAHLLYGAAVAGGVPVIPGILQGLGGEQAVRISGILNGTCNFMLSAMQSGAEYADVLAQAQKLGYAEADPTADVDGFDARAKLTILSRIALHVELDQRAIAVQSIRPISAVDFHYAAELGCTIRQVSEAEVDGPLTRARVAPMLVPNSAPLAWSHGTQNMVVTSGKFGGDVVFSGHGAGGGPTAVAVVSDLLAVAHNSASVELPVRRTRTTGEFIAPHYLRFLVNDKPGIVSSISGALARVGANIDSLLQRPGYPKNALPFVITTEPCTTSVIDRAVRAISKLPCMLQQPLCLQILEMKDKD